MVPVALALIGTQFGRATVVFMGWFGPRGLASNVIGLVYIKQEARFTGKADDPSRGYAHRVFEHLWPWIERLTGHQSLWKKCFNLRQRIHLSLRTVMFGSTRLQCASQKLPENNYGSMMLKVWRSFSQFSGY